MIVRVAYGRGLNRKDVLLGEPVVHHVKDFDPDSGRLAYESLNKALDLGQPFFPVVVDSYGGNVYDLLGVIDVFLASPVPVATLVHSKAMSCGAVLAGMGAKGMRFVGPNAQLLIHHMNTTAAGTVPYVKADTVHAEALERRAFEVLDVHCGHAPGFFLEKLRPKEGADWYISPAEAVALGLADHVRVPTFDVRVEAEMSLA